MRLQRRGGVPGDAGNGGMAGTAGVNTVPLANIRPLSKEALITCCGLWPVPPVVNVDTLKGEGGGGMATRKDGCCGIGGSGGNLMGGGTGPADRDPMGWPNIPPTTAARSRSAIRASWVGSRGRCLLFLNMDTSIRLGWLASSTALRGRHVDGARLP